MAEYPSWMLNGKAQMFKNLSAQEIEAVHSFLMGRMELELQPSGTQALDKNSVFLIETLLPNKKVVLEFLNKGTRPPVREARVVIFFGAQKHPKVTEFAVGPMPLPIYMRERSPGPGHDPSWASRPISKAEYSLILAIEKMAFAECRLRLACCSSGPGGAFSIHSFSLHLLPWGSPCFS